MPNGQPTLLVVDDEPVNVLVLEGMLRKNGFLVLRAFNGAEALRQARTARPDLILLDIMMPGDTGFDVCRELKSDPLTSDIPVIFVSAMDDVEHKVQGFSLGAVDYVSKPFELPEVLARVRLHIRLRMAREAVVREQRARLQALRDAQQAMLIAPEELPQAGFAVHYRPRQEAGGDFYDVTQHGEDIFGFFVADLSGHDVSGAFLTAALKALSRQYSGPLYAPAETLKLINDILRDMLRDGQFLTACYAQLNRARGCLTLAGAAHAPAVLVRGDGQAEVVETIGDVLGVFESVVLESRELRVRPKDRLYLPTDGLLDLSEPASGQGDRRARALARLRTACAEAASRPLDEAVESVVAACAAPSPADDILLLGVEV